MIRDAVDDVSTPTGRHLISIGLITRGQYERRIELPLNGSDGTGWWALVLMPCPEKHSPIRNIKLSLPLCKRIGAGSGN